MTGISDTKGSVLRMLTFNETSVTQQYEMVGFYFSWRRLQVNEWGKKIIRALEGHGLRS